MIRMVAAWFCPVLLFILIGSGCSSSRPATTSAAAATGQAGGPAAGLTNEEYQAGFGDVLDIAVYNHPELTQKIRVSPSGKVSYPFLGDLAVEGRTLPEITEMVRTGLSKGYVPNPQVTVNVSDVAGMKIYVLGEVRSPQVLRVKEAVDLVEAITEAGGFTRDANQSGVLLIRQNGTGPSTMDALNVAGFLKRSEVAQNPPLKRGDVVYVPPSAIANIDRFFIHLHTILMPIRTDIMEGIILMPRVMDALSGDRETQIQVE